jgi:predicted dehydrogenase
MERVKMGIIGAGMAWDKLHYPAYQRLQDRFSIEAICDKDLSKARSACERAGLGWDRAFESYQVMLNTVDIEAVDIMVPIDETYEVTKDVLAYNKNIIVEKPVSASVTGAKELIKLSKKSKMLVAENYRYSEENRIMKDLMDRHAIGQVLSFTNVHLSDFESEGQDPNKFASTIWRKHPDFKGGVFLDSAVHHFAGLRELFGDFDSVFARGLESKADFAPFSVINALISFKSGFSGQYSCILKAKETQAPFAGLRVFGTEGEIFLENHECGFVNYTNRKGEHQAIPYHPNEGYVNELVNFHDAITQNTPIASTPEKGLEDMMVVFDVLKSIETGATVAVTAESPKKKKAAAGKQ